MLQAFTNNGQKINVEGLWVAKYSNKQIVLSADLGEQVHCLNTIELKEDGTLLFHDKPSAIGVYDVKDEYDGLALRSCDLEEGICNIQRIPLDEDNYKEVFKALSK